MKLSDKQRKLFSLQKNGENEKGLLGSQLMRLVTSQQEQTADQSVRASAQGLLSFTFTARLSPVIRIGLPSEIKPIKKISRGIPLMPT